VVLEPNANWPDAKPYFTKIIYRQVAQPANQMALVAAGQADVADFLPAQFVKKAEADSAHYKVWTAPGNLMFQIFFNWKHKPFDDRRVRQALLYATPSEEIRKSVFLGLADDLKSVVPPNYPGYDPQWYTYTFDLDKAKALLNEAGVTEFSFDLTVPATDPTQVNSAIILKDAMAKIGITVNIKQVSMAVYTQARNDGSLQAFFFPGFPIVPDAGYTLPLVYSCAAFTYTANGYCNPDYDKLVHEANSTPDDATRMKLFSDAQRVLLQDDAGTALIGRQAWNLVTVPNIIGVSWDTPNIFYFDKLSRKE
jgi:peptide/nickel transport system substrate-binding protein